MTRNSLKGWISTYYCVFYLQLSQGIVALLLAGRLLGAQRDQLVDAVSHGSETKEVHSLQFDASLMFISSRRK